MLHRNNSRKCRTKIRIALFLTLTAIGILTLTSPLFGRLAEICGPQLSRIGISQTSLAFDETANKNANATQSNAENASAQNANKGSGDGKEGKEKENGKDKEAEKGGSAPSVCREVKLGPIEPTGDPVEKKLNGIGGATVRRIDADTLLVCGSPPSVDVIRRIAQRMTGRTSDTHVHETHAVRLFFLRKAADIATAINNSAGLSVPVKPLGDDLLIFASHSDSDDEAIHELKRWIALIDVPRPELSLLAWGVQLSSSDPEAIKFHSTRVRSVVSDYNDRLQSALEQGWKFLEVSRQEHPCTDREKSLDECDQFFAPELKNYLTKRYIWSPDGNPPTSALKPVCAPNEYCLGYKNILNPIQRPLSNLLIALIALQPKGKLSEAEFIRNKFIDCLESKPTCGKREADFGGKEISELDRAHIDYLSESNKRAQERPVTSQSSNIAQSDFATQPSSCEFEDERALNAPLPGGGAPSPAFNCFRQQLNESLSRGPVGHLPEIRRALADFLFQYKMAQYYPRDFVPWNQAASAQALNASLDPLIVAFNRDLSVFLRHLQDKIQRKDKKDKNFKKIDFSSDGIVTARVISGNVAKVDTTTQSYFPLPPTASIRDIIKQLNAEGFKAPSVLTDNLSGNAAALLTAAIQAEQRTTAKIGRDLNLQVTANTLEGASASEMQVEFSSGEGDNKPTLLTAGETTTSDDNLNRVAKHNIATKVRVDSQKLFEISSFASVLTRGRSVPLIPPFIEFPYIGNLARLRLTPGTVFHRSFAIVNAVIVPTAADLANRIEFTEDLAPRRLEPVRLTSRPEVKNGEAQTQKADKSVAQTRIKSGRKKRTVPAPKKVPGLRLSQEFSITGS